MKRIDRALGVYRAAQGEPLSGRAEDGPERRPAGGGQGDSERTREGGRVQELLKVGRQQEGRKGPEKAAKFLMLLSKDDAAAILKHLSPEEAEKIAREIAHTKRIERSEARQILNEFGVLKGRGATMQGGPEVARQMLVNAFGEGAGDGLFRKIVPFGRDNPFSFLNELEYQQILMLLKHEPAPVISVILPYLEPEKAADVLEAFHPDMQRDVVRRVARLQKLSPDMLQKVAEALRERIRKQGKIVTEDVDGRQILAGILRYMSIESEEDILEDLKIYDEELSDGIRERLFTIDVLDQITDQDLQNIVRDFSEAELATVLKGKREELRARVFGNMSERRSGLVREEMERLGPMKRSDVDKATREFLEYIRELVAEGRLVISREDDYLVE